jgi:hypothetical protein
MNYHYYKSKIGKVEIGFILNRSEEYIHLDHVYYELEDIKIFLLSLKKNIDELEKNNDYKYFRQTIHIEEWNNFTNQSNWTILDNNKDFIIIQCDINKSLDNIFNSLGIYENQTTYKTIIH